MKTSRFRPSNTIVVLKPIGTRAEVLSEKTRGQELGPGESCRDEDQKTVRQVDRLRTIDGYQRTDLLVLDQVLAGAAIGVSAQLIQRTPVTAPGGADTG